MTQPQIETGFIPRVHQFELFKKLKRFSVILAHRRFGKTVFAANWLVDGAMRCVKPLPRYFYIAPTYGQAKRIAWDIFKTYTKMIPGVEYNEAELRIDLPHNGARIQLLSGENPYSLKGIYGDRVVLDEYGDMNPTVWTEAVRPILADRAGEALFIGTVKGNNHFWELHELAELVENQSEWFTMKLKASETKILPQSELDSLRATMSEEEYNQEMECDPLAGLVGAYFAKELATAMKEDRIGKIAYDPVLPVDTYWDLGLDDMMAIWFCQTLRGQNRMIDYYQMSGDSIPDAVKEVQKRNYVLGRFVLPHDAQVRSINDGKSRVQMLYGLGIRNVTVVPRPKTKMDSINAARVALRTCWFDKEKCKDGLKALANYKKQWNEKNMAFSNTPLHNWASNGADAFQQFAMGVRTETGTLVSARKQGSRSDDLLAQTEYDPYTGGSYGWT